MAMIKCQESKKDISNKTKNCRFIGHTKLNSDIRYILQAVHLEEEN